MDTLKPERSTKDEIRKILIKHCSQIDRELVVWGPQKDKNADCYFLALAGSAPKGYGIYVHSAEKSFLCLYDGNGTRFKKYYVQKDIKFD